MPSLNTTPVTYTGPFQGLDLFGPRVRGGGKRRSGNVQKHLLQASNVRCKEHVMRVAPGNIRIPSKPASDTPYHLIVQWLVLQGDTLVPRLFLANGEKIFRGDFVAFMPPVIHADGTVYEETLDFILGNPPGFDLANYPGINTLLEDVLLTVSDPNTYQLNLSAVDANHIAVYAAEAVGTTERTIKFDNLDASSFTIFAAESVSDTATSLDVDDGAGGDVFEDITDNALLLNQATGEIMLVTPQPTTNTLTIQRGYAGTTAAAITDNDSLDVTPVGLPIFSALEKDPSVIRNSQTGEYLEVVEAPYTIFANEDTSDSDTSIDVDDGSGGSVFVNIRSGFVLTNKRTNEQMFVSATPGSDTLTVIRGYNNTTAESITDGDRLETDRLLTNRGHYGFPVAANIEENTAYVQTPFKYKWETLEGPPNLTISDDSIPSPVLTAPAAGGVWKLRAGVDDGYTVVCQDFEFTKDVAVTANAGPDQSFPATDPLTTEVQMTAGATGLNPTYEWSVISGEPVTFLPSPTALNPLVVLPSIGEEFVLRLRVTGEGGLTATDYMTIVREITGLQPFVDESGNQFVDELGNIFVG